MNKIQCVKIDEFNARINETFPEIIAIIETKLNGAIGNKAMPKKSHDYQKGQELRHRRRTFCNGW